MSTWPRHPVVYEVNTWAWLGDLSRNRSYDRDRREMQDSGLYVDLAPWQSHLFRVERHHA
jgi:hypothetical protein